MLSSLYSIPERLSIIARNMKKGERIRSPSVLQSVPVFCERREMTEALVQFFVRKYLELMRHVIVRRLELRVQRPFALFGDFHQYVASVVFVDIPLGTAQIFQNVDTAFTTISGNRSLWNYFHFRFDRSTDVLNLRKQCIQMCA